VHGIQVVTVLEEDAGKAAFDAAGLLRADQYPQPG
jgi:hypothetical protein